MNPKQNGLWTMMSGLGLALLFIAACAPDRDEHDDLLPTPAPPEFSVDPVPGDSNRFVITDLSAGFQRLWGLPGGAPKTSGLPRDTVFYAKAGTYTITLFVSMSDGSGTVSSSRSVTVTKDAPLECSPELALLTGDCGAEGKCWRFTTEAKAVKVGPAYGDDSWYTSPENGLQAAQYDDDFCFTFENLVYVNDNKGQSVNPWNGYMAEAYDPGVGDFLYLKGTGLGGRDQIVIPDDQFMGLWDFDNVMDVQELTADRLVLRARICDASGVPAAEGWFELTFIPR
jgi:hypothetical protein